VSILGLILLSSSSIWTIERRLIEGAIEEWEEPPFYQLPDPIPSGTPGQLLRSEKLESIFDGALAWRVLYHSTDVHNQNILVSGVVIAPEGEAPASGRTIISWGHPTTGAAQRCAPSVGIDPFDTIEGLRDLISAGYVVVATDYSGMGAAGPPSYLIGTTAGNNVLDAARAARSIPETSAGNNLVLWGHSQGGHAVLFAAESAAAYAPELNLLGAAVAAPATNLGELLQSDIGDVSGVTISSYALTAYSAVYSSIPGTNLSTILTPAGATETPHMATLCLFGQNEELHRIARPLIGHYLSSNPTTTEPWSKLLAQNTPGSVALPVPLFIAQGQTDELIDPEITARFAEQQRSLGTDVTYVSIPDTGHGLVALRALPKLLEWLGTLQG
jgi:pimeloyl-ACP methyl ester carboxylesterase